MGKFNYKKILIIAMILSVVIIVFCFIGKHQVQNKTFKSASLAISLEKNKNVLPDSVIVNHGSKELRSMAVKGAETNSDGTVKDPWLNGFSYRAPVTITSSSAITNYPVKITTNTATLVSNSKLQSGCGDLRFTSSDGYTQLSYWIESGCNTASTVVWVKLPSVVNGSTTIYMYYGNSSATTASSGTNTFVFYDDFDDGVVSDWTLVRTCGTGVQDAYGGLGYVTSPYVLRDYETGACGASSAYSYKDFTVTDAQDYTVDFYSRSMTCSGCTVYARGFMDGTQFHNVGAVTTLTRYTYTRTLAAGTRRLQVGMYTTAASSGTFYSLFDNVLIYKYVSSIPTTSLGSEVQLITPAGTSATSWTWKAPAINDKVKTGSATSWTWVTWQNDGVGLTLPYAAATNWVWYPDSISYLYLGYDDGARCYLNGQLAYDGIAEAHGVLWWNQTVDVTKFIIPGTNTLACWVANGGENAGASAGGLDLQLVVNGTTLISQSDDDSSVATKDANCAANPSFKYYTCSHPCEPANWYTVAFDDSAWSTGNAPFAPTATWGCTNAVTATPDDVFVRKTFTVTNF